MLENGQGATPQTNPVLSDTDPGVEARKQGKGYPNLKCEEIVSKCGQIQNRSQSSQTRCQSLNRTPQLKLKV